MKNLKYIILFLCGSFATFSGTGQSKKNRLQPGRMYEAGETLFAPRFGLISIVPGGWQGMLPRESEVFLLTTTTSTYGEIYVFGREQGELAAMSDAWLKGFDLSETIRLKAAKPIITDGVLTAEVIAEGEYINKGNKGFAIARCSSSGACVTALMVAPIQFYESVKSTVVQFMNTSRFEPPSNASPYTDFDWKDFLSNNVLAMYASVQGGSKETLVHLCADGTFTADIKKSGILKNQNPQYRGRSSGKWMVTGTGEETTIQFTFTKKNLPPFETHLTIKDEKVFSNGERYFVGQSDKCK